MRRAAVLAIALVLGAGAQDAASLFDAAHTALAGVPAAVAPRELLQIAWLERGSAPQRAAADVEQAFEWAVALPLPLAGDAGLGARAAQKSAVEQTALAQLVVLGRTAAALRLLRAADVPREPLYAELLGQEALAKPLDWATVHALVEDCRRQPDAFPYAALSLLLKPGMPPDEVDYIAQAGLAAAGEVNDAATIGEAARLFFPAMREVAPQFDSAMVEAAAGMAERMAYSGQADPAIGADLMRLIAALDAPRATALEGEYPAFAPQGAATLYSLGPLSPDAQAAALGPARPGPIPPPPPPTTEIAVPDPDAIEANPLAGAEAADRLQAAGRQQDAERVTMAALRAANDAAQRLDGDFAAAGAAEQMAMLNNRGAVLLSVYRMAAAIDFDAARRSAEELPPSVLKPLLLATLASLPRPAG